MTFKHWIPVLVSAVLISTLRASHDEASGARYVESSGSDVSDCLDHDAPCASVAYALGRAEPGNTIRVGAGIFDFSGLSPDKFLYGTVHATGGFSHDDGYRESRPEVVRTIAVGVKAEYRNKLAVRGFYWAASRAAAERGDVSFGGGVNLQAVGVAAVSCVQGSAGQFPCRNVSFQSQIALSQFSTRPASAANLWGFVDLNDNREYAVIGLRNGTAVVDVTEPTNPREVGTVPGNSSSWRELKVYQVRDDAANRWRAYAYVSTEAAGSGIQTIDLSGLPNSVQLASTISDTGSQHTLYVSNVNYGTNVALPGAQAFLYVAGANVNSGAWRVYSLANPAQPQLVNTAPPGSQYMHDSTSVLITDYRVTQCASGLSPCEVLIDFNENTVDLWDVTNKLSPLRLSSTSYPTATYTHSGWPSTDQQYVFVHDELEEIRRGLNTQIYTLNIGNLRSPSVVTSYVGSTTTTDHNGYTKGNYYYVSHYKRGLVVFDVTNPNQMVEVANFDNYLAPAVNNSGTEGTWGVYPFLPSGNIVLSDIENGLFVVKDFSQGLTQNAGQLGFEASALGVDEGAGTATIRVRRVMGSSGAVSVQFATSDGSATSSSDYTASSGTLDWAAGDLSDKTITINVTNDTQVESSESFRITLSNLIGGASLDGSSTLDVNITDNDAVVTPPAAGGGGGAMDVAALLLLLQLALLRSPRPRRGDWWTVSPCS